jgi:feruloyl esterase
MADALRRGYAVAGSDTGHQGDDLTFGTGHPEKIRDWAYRSTHEMAQSARQIIESYYRRPPEHRYFAGCSTGGQQALSEAERFPNDFDGIIAGDPGYNRISLNAMFVWSWNTTHPEDGRPFPSSKLSLVAHAAVKSCDLKDGVADGVISEPQSCNPDLQALRCQSSTQENCLTQDEEREVQDLYHGPRDPGSGRQLYPGWTPGSELGWGRTLLVKASRRALSSGIHGFSTISNGIHIACSLNAIAKLLRQSSLFSMRRLPTSAHFSVRAESC